MHPVTIGLCCVLSPLSVCSYEPRTYTPDYNFVSCFQKRIKALMKGMSQTEGDEVRYTAKGGYSKEGKMSYNYNSCKSPLLLMVSKCRMSIKHPTSGGQTCNQEATVQRTFHLERTSFCYLSVLIVKTSLYFLHSCTKCIAL